MQYAVRRAAPQGAPSPVRPAAVIAPLAYDGVHLSPEGHVKFAEGMIDALGRAFGYVRRGL